MEQHKLKKWHLPFLLFLIIGTVVVIRQKNAPVPYQKDEGRIFGTVYHATYQCDSSLRSLIEAELQSVDNSLSMFNPQSTISRINSNESLATDSLFRYVFTISQQISRATNGAFDITVAPLVNAWGFGFKHQQLPDSAQVDSLLQLVGWQRVSINSENELLKADPRMVLDCSAVAKGFGSDQVAALLRSRGIQNFMIEIGGEVVVSGTNPKGKPWRIGISTPDEQTQGKLQETIELTQGAMATSGNYRNFYTAEDGRRLAHTINPHTGYPVQHSILSSTVLAPTCAMADAFATSFMVMGLDSAQAVLEAHPELQAYFICSTAEGGYKIHTSVNWSYNK